MAGWKRLSRIYSAGAEVASLLLGRLFAIFVYRHRLAAVILVLNKSGPHNSLTLSANPRSRPVICMTVAH
jgi:hypothetical protein